MRVWTVFGLVTVTSHLSSRTVNGIAPVFQSGRKHRFEAAPDMGVPGRSVSCGWSLLGLRWIIGKPLDWEGCTHSSLTFRTRRPLMLHATFDYVGTFNFEITSGLRSIGPYEMCKRSRVMFSSHPARWPSG